MTEPATPAPTRRPAYPSGGIIPLVHARWISTHAVVAIERPPADRIAAGYAVRLRGRDRTLDLHHASGLALRPSTTIDGEETLVALCPSVETHVDDIVRYERAHPDEPPIGARRTA